MKYLAGLVGFILSLLVGVYSPSASAQSIALCNSNPGTGVPCPAWTFFDINSLPTEGGWHVIASSVSAGWDGVTYSPVGSLSGQTVVTVVCQQSPDVCVGPYGVRVWASITMPVTGGPPPASSGPCVPAFRTVAPCPSGYAPSSAEYVTGQTAADAYDSTLASLPLAELIFALGLGLAGLLGIGVGVRLT